MLEQGRVGRAVEVRGRDARDQDRVDIRGPLAEAVEQQLGGARREIDRALTLAREASLGETDEPAYPAIARLEQLVLCLGEREAASEPRALALEAQARGNARIAPHVGGSMGGQTS